MNENNFDQELVTFMDDNKNVVKAVSGFKDNAQQNFSDVEDNTPPHNLEFLM